MKNIKIIHEFSFQVWWVLVVILINNYKKKLKKKIVVVVDLSIWSIYFGLHFNSG